ncbi:rhomboid-like protein [Streptomyces sp. NPDC086787]|uniref:rhomboid-like protein n=1 Tax=Streptomyces sp. NPDC086787 TaxID=3365759 RepID=UPI0038291708
MALLDGVPRQRVPAAASPASVGAALVVPPPVDADGPDEVRRPPSRPRGRRLWRLVPTPTGTPFTFGYGALLAVTSLVARDADPGLVHTLHQASSTDVAHLARTPVLALVASALWIAGGLASPFALCFLVVLAALERRIGGARTAAVFLLGHVLATLATEVPVGLAVLAGHLPDSSLHRLDYGVSFGVATSTGALAGLLAPWLRRPLLALLGGTLAWDLVGLADPVTNWGHLIALAVGVATWPLVRRWQRGGPEGGRSSWLSRTSQISRASGPDPTGPVSPARGVA